MNSDVVFYQPNLDGSLVPMLKNTKRVGRIVLTKTLGTNGPREITDTYKLPEGKTTATSKPVRATVGIVR